MGLAGRKRERAVAIGLPGGSSGAVPVGPQDRPALTLKDLEANDAEEPDVYDDDFEDPCSSPSLISPITKSSPAAENSAFEDEMRLFGYTVDSAGTSDKDDLSQSGEEEITFNLSS